ncbi:MAG TPA: L-glutamate gamma-semialdehyde dehydrogenase [Dinghuibacter sp.]|uniref:L-glutamate gamma-semialdehyde dehydrogenase n=1 Tax=Dinghuibacter sp. TaxID=2024697 RepID=UPI002C222F2C|nr:L-glutamate gamma-semialdehyde dehydrogenase [Dinghuibacter sp.]HTJ14822.1 L-glutamate gamma-semialdehyde dehydrogenase [Dinghuibacter sp.]
MSVGDFVYPLPVNEPVLGYAPGSKERELLQKALKEMKAETADIPMYIGSDEVRTGKTVTLHPPHEHKHVLGKFHVGDKSHFARAIDAALTARKAWADLSWANRANIFLKAADLLATKYRYQVNAATMLGQSKNAYQAEIDSACELIDFLRFNVHFLTEIYRQQPISSPGVHNRLEYRPLEGFVVAITPFNFTAIAGNLPSAPALCGNVVVWKPSDTQVLAANVVMKIFREAGLPDGVINLVYGDGPEFGDTVFAHRDFAGVHFTGSTRTFNHIWKTIGENVARYRTYPRIVGETGGKDFVLVHKSAHADTVVTGLVRGAFEYQGQKCSAASRAYIPSNLAPAIRAGIKTAVETMKMGTVEDFGNFINAVIDERSFDKIAGYIDKAKSSKDAKILVGGTYDKNAGYFVAPTVIETSDPAFVTMCDEIFGPVLTIYTYEADDFEKALDLVDGTSPYALTGAVFAQDRAAVERATQRLTHSAGNFYINDKPTGAVVGQQPFGGARASGTNDKAGSALNLYRWLSARTIKENYNPPVDYRYPFLG